MKILAADLGAVVLLILVVGLWAVGAYNGLVARNENVSKAWAQVESQYQRRFDLIPNLVHTVQGAADFEKSTLQAVIVRPSCAIPPSPSSVGSRWRCSTHQ